MGDLPPDLDRLQVIRLYLQLQLDAVDAKIRESEEQKAKGGALGSPKPPKPEPFGDSDIGFRIQHVLRGGTLGAVVHRDDCPDAAGGRISRHEVEIALRMPEVTMCPRCHPGSD
ncbi:MULTISPECIES: DUF6233 domain-containing protein [unclassified Streptomyces]|uniref:DUF6233 domain-containing protein n=1 Tax=unclassified Streptomyces TaxID=2593676 RepID=UPI00131A2AD2|nr:DUF6233 domain-containing protein [Streptomyces sp. BoleA5]MYX34858.1 hypothetical protein [Streptomyces sp. SID8377]